MFYKKPVKISAFKYLIPVLILVVLSGALIQCSEVTKRQGLSPEQLLSDAVSSERYISTDELAEKIIGQDPSFILIDVRDPGDYESYSLPNAVNIPFAHLLDEANEQYLDQGQYDIIFYSNDNLFADQAWMLCKRLGYENLQVLEGGMNRWFTTIINPTVPGENTTTEDLEKYTARKASSMYFGVMYPEPVVHKEVVKKTIPKKVVPIKKKKKRPVEGGC